jgi:hypothetical protein
MDHGRDPLAYALKFGYDSLVEMLRIWYLLGLATLTTTAALGQSARPDPVFDNIPFDRWLKGGNGSKIDWSLSVYPPVLTELQRLRISVVATVDGSTVANWRNSSEMVFFLEVQGHQSRSYRTHLPLTLPEGDPYPFAKSA